MGRKYITLFSIIPILCTEKVALRRIKDKKHSNVNLIEQILVLNKDQKNDVRINNALPTIRITKGTSPRLSYAHD